MTETHLFIAKPFEKWSLNAETTPLIIKELFKRNCKVFISEPHDLFLKENIEKTKTRELKIKNNIFFINSASEKNLNSFKFIHIRTDPPVNMNYYYHLLILLRLVPNVKIINPPAALLSINEKLSILNFPNLITDTLVTSLPDKGIDFMKLHKKIIFKNLSDCSSRGIKKFNCKDSSSNTELFSLIKNSKEPVMLQKYLHKVKQGETRVTLINGVPAGWMKKIPKSPGFLASLDFGASLVKHSPNNKELKIIKKVGDYLLKNKILFAALDIIDGNLSEINITSPGLIHEMNEFCYRPIEKIYCDALQSWSNLE
jgi:glutathione synthase